jgi:hypothetical protein
MSDDERLSKAELGQRFTAKLYAGGQERAEEFEVKASCGVDTGQWYCVTHNESFRNQFEKDGHIHEGKHQLAWLCVKHGPEVP